jgi:UTP--glucose-1-phosphate uridylyltransferase
MKIRKAVVTAAGWGTRFLPATKAQPKEMLPLVDKPTIQYIVEEAAASGIDQIIIVTSQGKHAIENHFDRSFDLENALKKKGDEALLRTVQQISDLIDVCYVRQKEQLGLGHAVLAAEGPVGNEPFAVFLPDDIIAAKVPAMSQMLQVYDRYRCSVVAVEKVPLERISSYGAIKPKQIDDRVYDVLDIVEKPPKEQAPSDMGVVGRYILMPEIFPILRTTRPGAGKEIQLTDALRALVQEQRLLAYRFEGTRYDTGTPMGLLRASVEIALGDTELGPEFAQYLRSLRLPD